MDISQTPEKNSDSVEALGTLEEQINDGLADFDAGDYVFVYNVTVTEPEEEVVTSESG